LTHRRWGYRKPKRLQYLVSKLMQLLKHTRQEHVERIRLRNRNDPTLVVVLSKVPVLVVVADETVPIVVVAVWVVTSEELMVELVVK